MIDKQKYDAFIKYLDLLLMRKQQVVTDELFDVVDKGIDAVAKRYSDIIEEEFLNTNLLQTIEAHSVPYFLQISQYNTKPIGIQTSENVFNHLRAQVDGFLTEQLRNVVNKVNKDDELRDLLVESVIHGYNIGGNRVLITTILAYYAKFKKLPVKKAEGSDDFTDMANGFKDIVVQYSGGFRIQDPVILEALKSRINELVDYNSGTGYIDDRTFEKIKDILIQRFYVEGMGVSDFLRELETTGITPIKVKIPGKGWRWLDVSARARLIARTEISIAIDRAVLEAATKSGLMWKQWITQGDDRVRAQHVQNEGDGEIPLTATFSTGDFSPGRCASPWNCRCSLSCTSHFDDPAPPGFWDGDELKSF